MQPLVPVLRADFAVNETCRFVEEPPFELGISAFGGLGDREVTREDLEGWQAYTRGRFRLRMLPGDHFFPPVTRPPIVEAVARDHPDRTPSSPPPAAAQPSRG